MAAAASSRIVHEHHAGTVGAPRPASGGVPVSIAPAPARKGSSTFVVLAAVCALVGALFIAGVRMQHVLLTHQLSEVMDRKNALLTEQKRLEAELARVSSPEQLGARAAALGLHAPDPGQVRRVALH